MAWLLKKVKSSRTMGEAGSMAPVLPLHMARRFSPLRPELLLDWRLMAKLSDPPEVTTSGVPSWSTSPSEGWAKSGSMVLGVSALLSLPKIAEESTPRSVLFGSLGSGRWGKVLG